MKKNRIRQKFINFFKLFNIFSKINPDSNNLNDKIKKSIQEILFYAIVAGLLINYSLWGIFHLPFKLYTFPAYGIFLYLIKIEFMNLWARLWFRIIE